MFIPTIYPDRLRLPPFRDRRVAIVRTLRDGTITRQYLTAPLAEIVVALIPFDEPLVASARIAYSELGKEYVK